MRYVVHAGDPSPAQRATGAASSVRRSFDVADDAFRYAERLRRLAPEAPVWVSRRRSP